MDVYKYFTLIILQIKNEGMVEDINNLLNSGEVPNLLMMDEKIEICEKMRVLDKQRDKTLQVSKNYLSKAKNFKKKRRNELQVRVTSLGELLVLRCSFILFIIVYDSNGSQRRKLKISKY